jgi:hypothetical protein
VPLAATFQELCVKLLSLQDAMRDLAVSAAEDRPLRGGVLLADRLSDAAEDLQGWLKGALEAAEGAHQAVIHPTDLETVRQCLVSCQELFNVFTQRFASDLAHYEQMAELMRLGQERKGEWQAWAKIVRSNVERCQQPVHEITQALFRCWQEVAEQASKNNISIRTTSIGHQVNTSAPEWRTEPREFP